MRSEHVYRALTRIPNRFRLCQATARVTRVTHMPQTRTEDTVNNVLGDISKGKHGNVFEPVEIKPTPALDIITF
jgi:hypothetical protein